MQRSLLVTWIGYLYLSALNHILTNIPFFSFRYFILKYFYRMDTKTSSIHMGIKYLSPWNILIGKNSIIHFDCLIDGRGGITIGDNVDISFGVKIFTAQHPINDPEYSTERKNVHIGDQVVIGAYSIILPGVTIGNGSVIGAGSVVTKNIPPYTFAAGSPAHFKRKRTEQLTYQLSYKRPFH